MISIMPYTIMNKFFIWFQHDLSCQHYLFMCISVVYYQLLYQSQGVPDAFPGYTTHYGDVIMGIMASQITSLTIVYSTIYSGVDHRKHQRSASLAFVWGIHRWPVNSPHKWPVTRKMFSFDDVMMQRCCYCWWILFAPTYHRVYYKTHPSYLNSMSSNSAINLIV